MYVKIGSPSSHFKREKRKLLVPSARSQLSYSGLSSQNFDFVDIDQISCEGHFEVKVLSDYYRMVLYDMAHKTARS